MKPDIQFRPATLADAEMLLAWRNDPQTRKASHQMAPVAPEQHQAWLEASLHNPQRTLLIAIAEGQPIGTLRADIGEAETELSWTIAPEARGRGFGKWMVRQYVETQRGALRAEVKAGNMASVKIAEFAGLEFLRQMGEVLHFRRGALPN